MAENHIFKPITKCLYCIREWNDDDHQILKLIISNLNIPYHIPEIGLCECTDCYDASSLMTIGLFHPSHLYEAKESIKCFQCQKEIRGVCHNIWISEGDKYWVFNWGLCSECFKINPNDKVKNSYAYYFGYKKSIPTNSIPGYLIEVNK